MTESRARHSGRSASRSSHRLALPAPGELGLNIMASTGASVAVWMRSFKADGRYPYVPCATLAEERLALYLEYHPNIAYFQRADVRQSFLDQNGLVARMPVPIVVPYRFDDGDHDYYPDFAALTIDGRMVLAEAGLARYKAQPDGQAKAIGAIAHVAKTDGEFWLGTEVTISEARYTNLQLLHAHRGPIEPDERLVRLINEAWLRCPITIRELTDSLRLSFPAEQVQATAWHLAAVACARGRIEGVDLDTERLTLDTGIALAPDDALPLFPPPLPSMPPVTDESDQPAVDVVLPVDPSSIDDPHRRAAYLRNAAAWSAYLGGESARAISARDGRTRQSLEHLFRRATALGEQALIPYVHEGRNDPVDRAFAGLVTRMLRGKKKRTAVEIADSPEIRALSRKLTKENERVIRPPSVRTVRRYLKEATDDGALFDRAEHGRRPRRTPSGAVSYASRISHVAMLCEVDEHYVDLLISTVDGYDITTRLFAAVLIDVKTGCPMAGILSPARLAEEDYMRLVKQAIEPKDALRGRYGFTNEWPCTAKPGAIASDRGLIFTSQRARDVLVGRLNIRERIMPPEAPSAKGTVEAFFGSLTKRLMKRLPGTTMGSPAERDAYDSAAAARTAGITFEEAETYFYRWIVDVYLQDWDDLRDCKRIEGWRKAVESDGAPQFVGHPDELKLLLLKAGNRRTASRRYPVHGNGVSFLGLWYRAGSENLARRLRGREVDIFYDRRDITTIYVALDGVIVGHLTARELGHLGRVSEWELRAARTGKRPIRNETVAVSLANSRSIIDDAHRSKRDRQVAARAEARSRLHDRELADVHPADVLAERARSVRDGGPDPEPIELGPKVGPVTPIPVRVPRIVVLERPT